MVRWTALRSLLLLLPPARLKKMVQSEVPRKNSKSLPALRALSSIIIIRSNPIFL